MRAHAQAMARAMATGMYSKDNAGSGWLSPVSTSMLETFDVDLAELWLAVPRDELVESYQRHADDGVPSDPLESSIGLHVVHPGVGEGRDRRRTAAQMQLPSPDSAATPLASIMTAWSRPYSSRSTRTKSGCGSIAITRAPIRRKTRTRLPT